MGFCSQTLTHVRRLSLIHSRQIVGRFQPFLWIEEAFHLILFCGVILLFCTLDHYRLVSEKYKDENRTEEKGNPMGIWYFPSRLQLPSGMENNLRHPEKIVRQPGKGIKHPLASEMDVYKNIPSNLTRSHFIVNLCNDADKSVVFRKAHYGKSSKDINTELFSYLMTAYKTTGINVQFTQSYCTSEEFLHKGWFWLILYLGWKSGLLFLLFVREEKIVQIHDAIVLLGGNGPAYIFSWYLQIIVHNIIHTCLYSIFYYGITVELMREPEAHRFMTAYFVLCSYVSAITITLYIIIPKGQVVVVLITVYHGVLFWVSLMSCDRIHGWVDLVVPQLVLACVTYYPDVYEEHGVIKTRDFWIRMSYPIIGYLLLVVVGLVAGTIQISFWRKWITQSRKDRGISVNLYQESESSFDKVFIKMRAKENRESIFPQGLTMSFCEKTTTVILDPSKTKRTCVLRTLRGRQRLACEEVTMDKELRSKICMCPDTDFLFETLTVEETLEIYHKLVGPPTKQNVLSISDDFNMSEKAPVQVENLTDDSRKLLMLAVTFLTQAEVYLFDEPTKGLKGHSLHMAINSITRKKRHSTFIMTSSDGRHAERMADEMAVVINDKIRLCGSLPFIEQRLGVGTHIQLNISNRKSLRSMCVYMWLFAPTMVCYKKLSLDNPLSPLRINFFICGFGHHVVEFIITNLRHRLVEFNITNLWVSDIGMDKALHGFTEVSLFDSLVASYLNSTLISDVMEVPIVQQIKHWLTQADQATRQIRHSTSVDGYQRMFASVSSGSFHTDNGGLLDSAMSLTDFLKVVYMRYNVEHQSGPPSQRTGSLASFTSCVDYNPAYSISKNLRTVTDEDPKAGLNLLKTSASKLNMLDRNNNTINNGCNDDCICVSFHHNDNDCTKINENNENCCGTLCGIYLYYPMKCLLSQHDATNESCQHSLSMEVYVEVERCSLTMEFETIALALIHHASHEDFNGNTGFCLSSDNVDFNLYFYDAAGTPHLYNTACNIFNPGVCDSHKNIIKEYSNDGTAYFYNTACNIFNPVVCDNHKHITKDYSNNKHTTVAKSSHISNNTFFNRNTNISKCLGTLFLVASHTDINDLQLYLNIRHLFDWFICGRYCGENNRNTYGIGGMVTTDDENDIVQKRSCSDVQRDIVTKDNHDNNLISMNVEGIFMKLTNGEFINEFGTGVNGHSLCLDDSIRIPQDNELFNEDNCNNNNPTKTDNSDIVVDDLMMPDKADYDLSVYRMMVWGLDHADLPFPFLKSKNGNSVIRITQRVKSFPLLRHAILVSLRQRICLSFLILSVMTTLCLFQAMRVGDIFDSMQTDKIYKSIGHNLDIQPFPSPANIDGMPKSWSSIYQQTLHDLWSPDPLKASLDVCNDHRTFLDAILLPTPSKMKSSINLTVYYSENYHYLSLVTAMEALQRSNKGLKLSSMNVDHMYFNPTPLLNQCQYLDQKLFTMLTTLSFMFGFTSWSLILCMVKFFQDKKVKKFHNLLVLSGANGIWLYLVRTLTNTVVHVAIFTPFFIGFYFLQEREKMTDGYNLIFYFMLVQATFALCAYAFINCLVLASLNKMLIIVWIMYEGVSTVLSVIFRDLANLLYVMSPTTGLIHANVEILHEIILRAFLVYKSDQQFESPDCDGNHTWANDCFRPFFPRMGYACIAHITFFILFLITYKINDLITWQPYKAEDSECCQLLSKGLCQIQAFNIEMESCQCLALFCQHPSYHGLPDMAQGLMNQAGLKRGAVLFEGNVLAKTRGSESIGICPVEAVLEPCMTGRAILELIGLLRGRARDKLADDVDELLQDFMLDKVADLQVSQYSVQETKKLQVATSLIGDPKYLLLDHPTHGLHLLDQMRIWNKINAYRDRGHVVIITSDCADECYMLGTTMLVLSKHFIKLRCTREELKSMSEGYFAYVWLRRDSRGRAVPVVKVVREVQRRFHHGVFAIVDKVHDPYIVFSFVAANLSIELDHPKIYDTMENMKESCLIRHYEVREVTPQLSLEAYVHEWLPY